MKNQVKILGAIAAGAALLAITGAAFMMSHVEKRIPLGNERELKVTLEAGFGDIFISKGETHDIMFAQADIDRDADMDHCLEYDVRDNVGYLDMSTDCKIDDADSHHHGKSIHIEGLESRTWKMRFTDAIPTTYDIELGLGKGEIDMTGLKVKDFDLSTGASSVNLKWDKPNLSEMEDMNIEAGVGKFKAEGLCNAHFHHLKFEGGVGEYTLDFGGTLDHEVDADVQVGLGSLDIYLPEHVAARVVYEKSWISHLSIDPVLHESETEEGTYYTSNYRGAKGRINFHIDAGVGTVHIRSGSSGD
jgi:hypothetical protein